MGSCCSSPKRKAAYKQELGIEFLNGIRTEKQLPTNTTVIIIKLKALVKMPGSTSDLTGPYVELKLFPSDDVAGDQLQRSSYKAGEKNPRWEPPERFQFLITDKEASKLKFAVYAFDPHKDPDAIGDGVLNLKGIDLNASSTSKQVTLISPKDGKHHGQIEIEVIPMTIGTATSMVEHAIYEFQRWQPYQEWGHSATHFLPTDPGRWCDAHGKAFSSDMDKIAPHVPDNWTVSKSWYTISTADDADGWQYGNDFYSMVWYGQQRSGMVVRRRVWVRECVAPYGSVSTATTDNPIVTKAAAGYGGRRSVLDDDE